MMVPFGCARDVLRLVGTGVLVDVGMTKDGRTLEVGDGVEERLVELMKGSNGGNGGG